MILNTVMQETNSPLLGMSLAREGGEEQIFNKYTTLYDHLVTAEGAHRGESAQNTRNMRRSADQTTASTRHSGNTASTEFDWLRRGSPSLQEEMPLTGRTRISGQAPEGNFQNIPEEAGSVSPS